MAPSPRAACAAALLALCAVPSMAQTNPFARDFPPAVPAIDGRWNGVNLENRSNCASGQNNGNRGTYAQFDVSTFSNGEMVIVQSGITGLNCEYRGHTTAVGAGRTFAGTYSCTDGKQGSFTSGLIEATANRLYLRLATQLTGSESCSIDAILGMARLE